MSKQSSAVKNFFFSTNGNSYPMIKQSKDSDVIRKNLGFSISPQQFARIKHDVLMWRDAISEAENAYYPFRVKIQRIYQDTILNEHVFACMERRKDLTRMRDFKVGPEDGDGDDQAKLIFQKAWFRLLVDYILDAPAFGYSLVALGDLINDLFPNLTIIRRQNISPDRHNVTTWPNIVQGIDFLDPEFAAWHVWVPTPSDVGSSVCGFGYLYKVAKTEIYLRSNTTYNADFQETFGQPVRVGKTSKTEEDERAAFAMDLANMGSNAWILLDKDVDELEFAESKQIGAAYKSFESFETRLEKKISKVILGHADAMDSTPGKLGAGQDGEESPTQLALAAKQMQDGQFVEDVVNGQLIPKLQELGFKIPATYKFQYVNNGEEEEFRQKEDESNQVTATIFKTISDAGGEPDWKYFSDRTGIPVEKKEEPLPMPGMPGAKPIPGMKPPVKKDPALTEKQKNRLNTIYKNRRHA